MTNGMRSSKRLSCFSASAGFTARRPPLSPGRPGWRHRHPLFLFCHKGGADRHTLPADQERGGHGLKDRCRPEPAIKQKLSPGLGKRDRVGDREPGQVPVHGAVRPLAVCLINGARGGNVSFPLFAGSCPVRNPERHYPGLSPGPPLFDPRCLPLPALLPGSWRPLTRTRGYSSPGRLLHSSGTALRWTLMQGSPAQLQKGGERTRGAGNHEHCNGPAFRHISGYCPVTRHLPL